MTVPSLEGIRVLLADDHATVRMGFRLLLEGAGATVIGEADSGEAAVSAFDRTPPDVLMMDVSMPGIGGLGALERVRAHHPDARLLILSAHDDAQIPARAHASPSPPNIVRSRFFRRYSRPSTARSVMPSSAAICAVDCK